MIISDAQSPSRQLRSSRLSDSPAIVVQNVAKCFKQYHHPVDRLKELLLPNTSKAELFWALQNINLEVPRGQTLGIVGRNGSGKSTLLQIIVGTLTPTRGQVQVNGRVSALLELGSGFNPEFTGRQNVFFNGQLMGLSRQEIAAKFDEIAAFADIGHFIDQPVKTYSSGMFVRLAFAVATSVEPDILIVDEALSVGDEAFQRKCFARIHAIRERGGTILFVSHAAPTIISLCDRAILLDSGEMLLSGMPKTIVAKYQKLIYAPPSQVKAVRQEIYQARIAQATETSPVNDPLSLTHPAQSEQAHSEKSNGYNNGNGHKNGNSNGRGSNGNGDGKAELDLDLLESYDPNLIPSTTIAYVAKGAKIHDPKITTLDGKRVNHLVARRAYIYTYTVEFLQPAQRIQFGMLVKTISGFELGGSAFPLASELADEITMGSRIVVQFRFQCLLQPGVYFLNAGVSGIIDGESLTHLARYIDVAMFRVYAADDGYGTGIVDLLIDPTCTVTSQLPDVRN
ncbi:ABC transporter ATP-binding protein [Trichothermofontia sp.]